MNKKIFYENETKRIDYPLSRLLCFVMFMVWQMGIIYYMGPSLTISGKVPLPIVMDNVTLLIALGYICAIIFTVIVPKFIVQACRVTSVVSFISVVGLFIPLSPEALTMLLYIQCFCCCFMITFETATMTFYFTEKSIILHLLVAYPIGYFIVAFLQNDVSQPPFSWFRVGLVIMVGLVGYFYFRLPSDCTPRFVRKTDNIVLPKKMFFSIFVMIFFACILAVVGPAAVSETEHGVSVAYTVSAISSLIIYLVWKRKHIHPARIASISIGLGALGFLFLFVSIQIPQLALLACALLGIGLIPCMIIPLYELVMMKQYPTRFIHVFTMIFALCAVLISSGLLEIFRNNISALYLSYLVITIILLVVYLQLAPFLNHTLHQTPSESSVVPVVPASFSCLTQRELEVANLICHGHSNKDIAKMLFISEHTAKDHTKNIYRKLGIHSRFELAAMFNKH